MSKLSETIKMLKEKRTKMVEMQKEVELKRANNDPEQFYEDSLKINNVNDGMVIIITQDEIIREKAPGGMSHRKICQDIFDAISDKHIDFSQVDGDYGNFIPKEYGCIFIRIASVLNGPTIIYYPESCNQFQIEKLIEFNEQVKKYNSSKKEELKVTFEYDNKSDEECNSLDELIETLNYNRVNSK